MAEHDSLPLVSQHVVDAAISGRGGSSEKIAQWHATHIGTAIATELRSQLKWPAMENKLNRIDDGMRLLVDELKYLKRLVEPTMQQQIHNPREEIFSLADVNGLFEKHVRPAHSQMQHVLEELAVSIDKKLQLEFSTLVKNITEAIDEKNSGRVSQSFGQLKNPTDYVLPDPWKSSFAPCTPVAENAACAIPKTPGIRSDSKYDFETDDEVKAEVKDVDDSKAIIVQAAQVMESFEYFEMNKVEPEHKLALDADYHETDPKDITLESGENVGALFGVFFSGAEDDAIDQPTYHVEDFYSTSGCVQSIARSNMFGFMGNLVIVLNAIYIMLEADLTAATVYDQPWQYQVISQSFCLYFLVELLVRFMAFQVKRDCLKDGWFRFDFFLIVVMVLDYWVWMPLVHFGFESGMNNKMPSNQLRILKTLKLTRLMRFMVYFPELGTMVSSMIRGVRSTVSALLLILFMIYIFGTFLHSLLRNEDELNNSLWQNYQFKFTHLFDVCWCLMMDGVLQLDNTALILTTLIYSHKFHVFLAGCVFLVFTLLANILVLQMVIACLCDIVSNVTEEQRSCDTIGLAKQYLLDDLKLFCDADGSITRAELVQVLTSPQSKALLKKLKINRGYFCEMASLLYVQPDTRVPIRVIMNLFCQCRGDNNVNVDVVASGFAFLTKELTLMEKRIIYRLEDGLTKKFSISKK